MCLLISNGAYYCALYTVKNVLKFNLILLVTPGFLFTCIRLFPAILQLWERNKNIRQRAEHTNQEHKYAIGSILQAGPKCEELGEEAAGFFRGQPRVVSLFFFLNTTSLLNSSITV